jgi:hypothetical protein
LIGLASTTVTSPAIGIGIAVGALLAFVNALLLSHRVESATSSGDVARAMAVMQLGLAVTFTIVGVATIVLVRISVPLAVSAAVGFAVSQLAILGAFYWSHGRAAAGIERKAP